MVPVRRAMPTLDSPSVSGNVERCHYSLGGDPHGREGIEPMHTQV